MTKSLNIKTTQKIVPMCYAYTTPQIRDHDGWTKIGYTEQNVEDRIDQQTKTANVEWVLGWKGTAIYDDGSGDTFRDHDFHAYLQKTMWNGNLIPNGSISNRSRRTICLFRSNPTAAF